MRVRPYLFRGYWAMSERSNRSTGQRDWAGHGQFWDRHPIYASPAPSARDSLTATCGSIVSDSSFLDRCVIEDSIIGLRTHIQSGTRITSSVLLGADFYEDDEPPKGVPELGIGRDVVLERTIADKNARIGNGARLVNERGVEQADGEGYYIRGGIIVVPKGGVIPAGTVV
jgi:glucose-1-phosphate adenylyltransferase